MFAMLLGADVTLTDQKPLLNFLNKNIKQNMQHDSNISDSSERGGKVNAEELNWYASLKKYPWELRNFWTFFLISGESQLTAGLVTWTLFWQPMWQYVMTDYFVLSHFVELTTFFSSSLVLTRLLSPVNVDIYWFVRQQDCGIIGTSTTCQRNRGRLTKNAVLFIHSSNAHRGTFTLVIIWHNTVRAVTFNFVQKRAHTLSLSPSFSLLHAGAEATGGGPYHHFSTGQATTNNK